MLVSVLALTACVDVANDECGENQYLALNGSCVNDHWASSGAGSDDTGHTVDEDDVGTGADQLVTSIDIACSASEEKWTYTVSTATATEGASFEVFNSVTGQPSPPELHTLKIEGPSSTGGETYSHELLLVDDYYQEDVSSQFPCTDGSPEAGTNNELTWKIDFFANVNRTVPIGCVVLGHDPAAFPLSECKVWPGP